jgi:hypothetical protein
MITKRNQRESSSSIVEVALLAPWIFFLFIGMFDFGFCAYAGCTVVNENHVTATSPSVSIEPGNPGLNLTGVFYQPRGAWFEDDHGVGFTAGDLMIMTGSFRTTTGTDKLLLQGPTNPLITYKAVLIQ